MALLQISEPGQSTAPHQHRLAVGIDLGTTNSLVATVLHRSTALLQDWDETAGELPSEAVYKAMVADIVEGRESKRRRQESDNGVVAPFVGGLVERNAVSPGDPNHQSGEENEYRKKTGRPSGTRRR